MVVTPIFEAAELRALHCGPSESGQKRLAQARRERLLTIATDNAIAEALDLGDHLPLAVVVANDESILAQRAVGDRCRPSGDNQTGIDAELEVYMDALAHPFSDKEPLSIATNFEPSTETLEFLAETSIKEIIFCIERKQLVERGLVGNSDEAPTPLIFNTQERLGFPFSVALLSYPALVARNELLFNHTVFGEELHRPMIDDVSALQADLAAIQ